MQLNIVHAYCVLFLLLLQCCVCVCVCVHLGSFQSVEWARPVCTAWATFLTDLTAIEGYICCALVCKYILGHRLARVQLLLLCLFLLVF